METIDCSVFEDLLPLYVDASLSPASENLVKEHLSTCSSCTDLLDTLVAEARSEKVLVTYDPSVLDFSRKIKTRRRWLKILVSLALVVMLSIGFLLALFIRQDPFDYVAADLGDYGRSAKQIKTYLSEGKLPVFLPETAEDISLVYDQNKINGKFHLSSQASQKARETLFPATVVALKGAEEAIPGHYNGVKEVLETAPKGASYYQDDVFVYVFMTDGTVYFYGK